MAYDYRTMTPQQRQEVVEERRKRGFPWHSPPHFPEAEGLYMLTAACYEHQMILTSAERLTEMAQALLQGLVSTRSAARSMPGWYYPITIICWPVRTCGRLRRGSVACTTARRRNGIGKTTRVDARCGIASPIAASGATGTISRLSTIFTLTRSNTVTPNAAAVGHGVAYMSSWRPSARKHLRIGGGAIRFMTTAANGIVDPSRRL